MTHIGIGITLYQFYLIHMALPVHTKGISLTLKMMELTGYKSKTELHNLLSGLYYLDRLAKRLLNLFSTLQVFIYRKIASSDTSRLEAHAGFFRLLVKEISDSYVL